ncbi:MAG: GspE/PulE family protein, partial [Clostridia bacterium]
KIIDSDTYYEAVAKSAKLKFVKSIFVSNQEAIKNLPEKIARKNIVAPIDLRLGKLVVAISDPYNIEAVEEIKLLSGKEVELVVASKERILESIDAQYSNASAQLMAQDIDDTKLASMMSSKEIADIDSRVDNTPIVKLVNTLVLQAYLKRASDIHIEPFKDYVVIRMRIDGDLQEYLRLNIASHQNIVTRIKIMSEMNIAEKRIPLDGRFEYNCDGISVDIRVSTLPTTYGEKVVMRLLGTALSANTTLDTLGMTPNNLKRFMKICHAPNGVIFVTGPTGSGKSTTLYTVLQDLNKPTVNVTTVEDPVEKHVEGINQVQVNQKAGMTFSSALRSILRQDPDVIMIGECRDFETAEITMRSAITGHVVLSTLHTNDAVASISRLIDMGVEPYLVATAVNGLLAQRLVKVLCPQCKRKVKATEQDKLILKDKNLEYVWEPVGCPNCNNSGYSGRTAVHEVVELDIHMRDMITENKSMDEIRAYAASQGVVFLAGNLLELIKEGRTTVAEYRRTVYTA